MEIETLRHQMDEINEQMLALFIQRMHTSLDIAAYKQKNGLPVLDREREREILNRVSHAAGEELGVYARLLFSTLMDCSRSYQSRQIGQEAPVVADIRRALKNTPEAFPRGGVIACQGVEGAYSQIAASRVFPQGEILYVSQFEGVFQAVESGLCAFGILPIENSTYGSVNAVYDLMKRYRVSIVRSVRQHIDHALLACKGVTWEGIQEIISHEQAIGQCSAFLKAHPHVRVTVCENTAVAAKTVAESGRDDLAAIASRRCAELYGLRALDKRVANSDNNYTRFICIAKDLAVYPGAGRISVMASLPHRPGALYEVLQKCAVLGINLTKLESRPIPGSDFEFMFYFDMEADVKDPAVQALLGDVQQSCEQFAFLGSYAEI
jgi:chorismate mutase/prephenate dehydratase